MQHGMQAAPAGTPSLSSERLQQMAHKQQAEASLAAAEQQRELMLFQVI